MASISIAKGQRLTFLSLHPAAQVAAIFLGVFAYTLIAGLALQLVLLPKLLPHLHGGHGLVLGGDSVGFQTMASALADKIIVEGWQIWELRPNLQAPVGVTAAVYAITGIHEPYMVLPLYGLLFALAAASIFAIVRDCTDSPYAAVVGMLPFTIFPSAAIIFSDLHKDVWSCAGFLLLMAAWIRLERVESVTWMAKLTFLAAALFGGFLIWVVRPYLMEVIVVILSAVFALWTLLELIVRTQPVGTAAKKFILYACCIFMLAIFPVGSGPALGELPADQAPAFQTTNVLDKFAQRISTSRAGFVRATGGSKIDADTVFNSFRDLFAYLPRALQIGLLAPFPTMWFSDGASPAGGAMRAVVSLEMAVVYLLFGGLIFAALRCPAQRVRPGLMVLLASVLFIVALSLVVVNVGALYRQRYSAFMLLVALGAAGWTMLVIALLKRPFVVPDLKGRPAAESAD